MKEVSATVTSKGQVTIPIEVRQHLGLETGERVTFVINDEGGVALKTAKYPSVRSLVGAAGRLNVPREIDKMLEIAREDALNDEYRTDQ